MATKEKKKQTRHQVVDATGSVREEATRALEKMHRDASRLLRRERANAPSRPDAPPKGCSARTWRTAVHEAGHVVAAHMLGIRLGPVTIVPGKGPDGVAFLGEAKLNVDGHRTPAIDARVSVTPENGGKVTAVGVEIDDLDVHRRVACHVLSDVVNLLRKQDTDEVSSFRPILDPNATLLVHAAQRLSNLALAHATRACDRGEANPFAF